MSEAFQTADNYQIAAFSFKVGVKHDTALLS
jgi:hypothetical protein